MAIKIHLKKDASQVKSDVEEQFKRTQRQLEVTVNQTDLKLKRESFYAGETASGITSRIHRALKHSVGQARVQVVNALKQAKRAPEETLKGITRQMAEADQTWAAPERLKRRLDWGEPALTVVDVRHRDNFMQEHIRGAVSTPEADLVERIAAMLEPERDIFIYGETETQMHQSARSLIDAGYKNVAAISGGLEGWKSVDGPTEGIEV